MSIEHDIQVAKSPREAVLILARAIDAVNVRLDAADQEVDPWNQWSAPAQEFAREHDALLAAQQIADVERQLAGEISAEDRQALTARLALLKDTGKPFVSPVQEGRRAGISSDGTNGWVDVVPVSEGRKQARRDWAVVNKLDEYIPLDIEAAADAFAEGGPDWLVRGNRDAVMQLPFAARQWLVLDLMEDSQAAAQEVGRDILKSEDSTDKNITLDAIDAMSGR